MLSLYLSKFCCVLSNSVWSMKKMVFLSSNLRYPREINDFWSQILGIPRNRRVFEFILIRWNQRVIDFYFIISLSLVALDWYQSSTDPGTSSTSESWLYDDWLQIVNIIFQWDKWDNIDLLKRLDIGSRMLHGTRVMHIDVAITDKKYMFSSFTFC